MAVRRPAAASAAEIFQVAGVDGCRGGWFVVIAEMHGEALRPAALRSCFVPTFAEVLQQRPVPRVVAVDMPIGLLDVAEAGGRACDRAARKLLGRPRASSVFSPPTRPGLAARDYAEVARLNGAGMSKEAFNILPKIREIDDVITAQTQNHVVETHPELAFARLANGPILLNKKTATGRDLRCRLLRRALGPAFADPQALRAGHPARHVALDDVIDACVLAETAMRIATGRGHRLPYADPPRDAKGLRMEIWF